MKNSALLVMILFIGLGASATAQTHISLPAPASGHSDDLASLTPADVLARVDLLSSELALVRRETGQPTLPPPSFRFENAAPREVFFQALALFHKADRLCFQWTGDLGEIPATPSAAEIRPGHVFQTVNRALERVLLTKDHLDIVEGSRESPAAEGSTPTDVITAIWVVNRELNAMVEQRLTPADVYQQVATANGFADRLLERFPQAPRPRLPERLRHLRPQDVYSRLIEVFEITREIAAGLDVEMGRAEVSSIAASASPGDVYDFASLVVAELSYLHSLAGDLAPPEAVDYPGRKVPSDVFQVASLLQEQVTRIRDLGASTPGWLTGADR